MPKDNRPRFYLGEPTPRGTVWIIDRTNDYLVTFGPVEWAKEEVGRINYREGWAKEHYGIKD